MSKDLQSIFQNLKQGDEYEVFESFCDYDGVEYKEGLRITFIGAHLAPIEKSLSLFFFESGEKIQIRLRWDEALQADICDDIEFYIDYPV